jgi:hypothetical protein
MYCYIYVSHLWMHSSFRAEKVALGKWPGRLKVLGALTCVGGTMVVSLLKGHLLHLWPTHLLKASRAAGTPAASGGRHRDMLTGTLFLCGSCLGYALWFIVQVDFFFAWRIGIHISLPLR